MIPGKCVTTFRKNVVFPSSGSLNLSKTWSWKKEVLSNHVYLSAKLHGVTSRKTALVNSNLRLEDIFIYSLKICNLYDYIKLSGAFGFRFNTKTSSPTRPPARPPVPIQLVPGGLSQEVELPGREADHLHPVPSVRICRTITQLQLYTFVAWTGTTSRFTITGCLAIVTDWWWCLTCIGQTGRPCVDKCSALWTFRATLAQSGARMGV